MSLTIRARFFCSTGEEHIRLFVQTEVSALGGRGGGTRRKKTSKKRSKHVLLADSDAKKKVIHKYINVNTKKLKTSDRVTSQQAIHHILTHRPSAHGVTAIPPKPDTITEPHKNEKDAILGFIKKPASSCYLCERALPRPLFPPW